MKKYIISVLTLAAALVSCTKLPYGAGDATIAFEGEEYVYKESTKSPQIPVVFTGEPKEYPITFIVAAEVVSGNVEVAQVMRFNSLTMEPLMTFRYVGDKNAPAFVEFTLVDDKEDHGTVQVRLTIESAEGAEIVPDKNSVLITINDND
ncbi:MAG: hypothetical protein ACI4TM_10415 [Candidatus Cryptobacteroides sp.]